MIDLHTHVLPGLDDGAEDLEEAVEMMRMAAADGTTEIAGTPHADLHFAFSPEAVSRTVSELSAASDGSPKLHSGCELHLTYEHIQDCLAHPDKYALAGSRYVLAEPPEFLTIGIIEEILGRFKAAGLYPILVHPERNPVLARKLDTLRQWSMGKCLLQLTAGSLLGRFGKRAEFAANQLLSTRHVHIVASDAHDAHHRPPILSTARDYVSRRTDEDYARRLFLDNPASVLRNELLPPWTPPDPRPRRRWFFFS